MMNKDALRTAFLAGYERGQSWEDPDHDATEDFNLWVASYFSPPTYVNCLGPNQKVCTHSHCRHVRRREANPHFVIDERDYCAICYTTPCKELIQENKIAPKGRT